MLFDSFPSFIDFCNIHPVTFHAITLFFIFFNNFIPNFSCPRFFVLLKTFFCTFFFFRPSGSAFSLFFLFRLAGICLLSLRRGLLRRLLKGLLLWAIEVCTINAIFLSESGLRLIDRLAGINLLNMRRGTLSRLLLQLL